MIIFPLYFLNCLSYLNIPHIFKESEHARRSERMIDEQINIAVESRETLMSQRLAFKAIQVILVVIIKNRALSNLILLLSTIS